MGLFKWIFNGLLIGLATSASLRFVDKIPFVGKMIDDSMTFIAFGVVVSILASIILSKVKL